MRRLNSSDGLLVPRIVVLIDRLAASRCRFSSRLTPPRTPGISVLIHAAVLAIWVALFLLAFGQGGILAWSIGLAYLGYDATLLVFTGWHIRRLTPTSDAPVEPSVALSVAVLVAVHNEAAVLPATIGALLDADRSARRDRRRRRRFHRLHRRRALHAVRPHRTCGRFRPSPPTSARRRWCGCDCRTAARRRHSTPPSSRPSADIIITVDGDTLLERASDSRCAPSLFRVTPNWSASPESSRRYAGRRQPVGPGSSSRPTNTSGTSLAGTRGCVSTACN